MRTRILGIAGVTFIAVGCVPNTYYSTTDPYVTGLRWFDRDRDAEAGRLRGLTKPPSEFYENTVKYWEPLLQENDCDAEYMMGTVCFLGKGNHRTVERQLSFGARQPKAINSAASGLSATCFTKALMHFIVA